MNKLVSVASALSLMAFAGAAAHATVVYDNAAGFPAVNLPFTHNYCSSCGGMYQVYQPFALDAAATIDHVDFAESDLSGTDLKITFWNNALDTLLFSQTVSAGDYSTANIGYNWDIVSADIAALSLDGGNYYVSFQSSDMTIAGFDSGLASYVQTFSSNDANPSTDLDGYPQGKYGAFQLSASSPAPEPASWALMLGGFGLIGGALRSGRKTVVSFG